MSELDQHGRPEPAPDAGPEPLSSSQPASEARRDELAEQLSAAWPA